MEYIKNPMMIEEKSFIMIQEIIDEIRPGYKFKNEIEEKIIKRSIHTTADFEYLDIEKGITRSMAAVEIAARDKGRKLFVFGNAPTALYKAMEMRD